MLVTVSGRDVVIHKLRSYTYWLWMSLVSQRTKATRDSCHKAGGVKTSPLPPASRRVNGGNAAGHEPRTPQQYMLLPKAHTTTSTRGQYEEGRGSRVQHAECKGAYAVSTCPYAAAYQGRVGGRRKSLRALHCLDHYFEGCPEDSPK